MNCRKSYLFSVLLIFVGFAIGDDSHQTSNTGSEFQWLEDSGDTSGIKYATHRLQPISPQADIVSSADIETEKQQLDSNTTRITKRAFDNSVNGRRQLVETVVEEYKKMPDGRMRAVRTVLRRDMNGDLSPAQKEIQELIPLDSNAVQITKTLMLPGINNSLTEKEKIKQVERRRSEQSIEIDRTRYVSGSNGEWSPSEHRVSENHINDSRCQTDERVYIYGVNKQSRLSQEVKIDEWKDAAGLTYMKSESYVPNAEGSFQLSSRLTMIQTPLQAGRQETTETIERRDPAAPNGALKLVQKLVEKARIRNPTEIERQLEILKPDLSGKMQTIQTYQSVETK